jgi:hypothetical protein
VLEIPIIISHLDNDLIIGFFQKISRYGWMDEGMHGRGDLNGLQDL